MKAAPRHVLVALDGLPIGRLEATERAYRFSYFPRYEASATAIPLSMAYPLQKGPWDYSFAGELPPYFQQLLPEGWLADVAEKSHLPMSTPLEKLATLCRENLGAVEIYQTALPDDASYETICEWIKTQKAEGNPPILFQANGSAHQPPQWAHCLRCHEKLPRPGYNSNYHDACSSEFFGSLQAPHLDVDGEKLQQIAIEQLKRHESLTGVQPKFSAIFKDQRNALKDFRYIVKPEPTFARVADGVSYQHSSLAELATMHFAELLELEVAETALLYLNGERPALISKRFDREEGRKIHSEDFAQVLSSRDKYGGSHEQIANLLKKKPDAKQRQRELQRFFKVILFNFLIGNADGHLKNYSIFHENNGTQPDYSLTPFYDLMPVLLFASLDQDQLALTVGGKRSKLQQKHFRDLAIKFGLNVRILTEFAEEFRANLDFYYEAFKIFGVPQDLVEVQRKYVERQLTTLTTKE